MTKSSRIQNGDSLTFHVNGVQIQSTSSAFAALLGDGSVVTWGDPSSGGDSSAVQGPAEECAARSKPLPALLLPYCVMDQL